jgi:tetratricopeptide (TPR) repeat protein
LTCLSFSQDDPLRRAVDLDAEQKCDEAERYYEQALAKSPASPAVLNNTGNHYLICGEPAKAERYFDQLLKINPAHANANLQMARIAADRKQGAKALQYLSRVKDSSAAVEILRAEASESAGKHAEALRIVDSLRAQADADARVGFALGIACARMGLYERAEAAFNSVLAKHPDDFDVLFNLGRAAARAQHYDRALRALEVALKLQPTDVDTLFELGRVHAATNDSRRAVYVLAQARQRAPKRPDILLALARAAEDAGYYGDSALAYDEYLQIQPGDDTVRRDRARVYGYTGTRLKEGLSELDWYIRKHPDDPIGYYNLAQFSWTTDPQKALDQLATALRLDPGLAPARYSRAWLLNRLGRPADSLPDLQAAVRIHPKNVRALDQLGLTYLTLDQAAQAEQVLRQALAISPEDPEVLLHLGRALMALDREQEARRYVDKFQKVRPQRTRDPRREPGMIELATLPAAERTEREIRRLREDAHSHPGDPDLQLHLALLLLADRRVEEAAAEFRTLLAMNADSRIWTEAGTSLVRAEQYVLAREFLERAADTPGTRLDLAIALFFTDGPERALQTIEGVPNGEQTGDYLLMKARILDAAGQRAESEKVLQEGLRHSISRPEVALQALPLLVSHDRNREALDLLDHAIKSSPDSVDLLVTRAIVLGLIDQNSAAEKALKEIESRWPEWDRAYVVHGLVLERSGRPKESRQKLQTAIALGSRDLAVRCALARLASSPSPDAQCGCQVALKQLLLPSCNP